jgi:hypothetical protein
MNHRRPSLKALSVVGGIVLLIALMLPAAPAIASPEGEIRIDNNSEFDREHGVRSGKGTKKSPYVIEGWDLHNLEIHDTDRYVTIRNNVVGTLRLNWIGDRVKIVHNRIGDLRVNENVKRTGAATSGVVSWNRFGHVGQLRHWDGKFSHNIVGSRESVDRSESLWSNHFRIANLDGFNGARYTNNTFYGYVETRLHGHHHSSAFGDHSHYHGSKGTKYTLDHMERYHRMVFAHNRIYSSGPYALIYTDSAHSANDRTAESETNEALNDPHVHHTRVTMVDNDLNGAGLVVDIFNADDQKHLRTERGQFSIRNNDISVREYRHAANPWEEAPIGIEVHEAKDINLQIEGNKITGPSEESTTAADMLTKYVPAGIRLLRVSEGMIRLSNNSVSNREAGIYARDFQNVHWWINGFKTSAVSRQVDYDNSSRQPHEGKSGKSGSRKHDH